VLAATAAARTTGRNLNLFAYSTPKAARSKLIHPVQATPTGAGVTFTQSCGASGDRARAVTAGPKTDIVKLSLARESTLSFSGPCRPELGRAGPQAIVSTRRTASPPAILDLKA